MLISVIGTAGRKNDAKKLNKDIYIKMYGYLCGRIESICDKKEDLHLQSGGAAYADHLAVMAFLKDKCASLSLYLPAEFDFKKAQFVDNGGNDWKTNPGGTSNYYHREFQKKTGLKSFRHIVAAKEKGANIVVRNGLFARNADVAKCDAIIAFTFGEGNQPADGGTKHTYDLSTAPLKIHVPIQSLHSN